MALPYYTPQDYMAATRLQAFRPLLNTFSGYGGTQATDPTTGQPTAQPGNNPPGVNHDALGALALMANQMPESGLGSPMNPPGQNNAVTGAYRGSMGEVPPGATRGLGSLFGLNLQGPPGLTGLIGALGHGIKSGVAPSPGYVGAALLGTMMGLMPGFSGPVGALGTLLNMLGFKGSLDPHAPPGASSSQSETGGFGGASDPASAMAGSDPASAGPAGAPGQAASGPASVSGPTGVEPGFSGNYDGTDPNAAGPSAGTTSSQSSVGAPAGATASMGEMGKDQTGYGYTGTMPAMSVDVQTAPSVEVPGFQAPSLDLQDPSFAGSLASSDPSSYGGVSNFGGDTNSGSGSGSGSDAAGGSGSNNSGGDMSGEGMGGYTGGHVQLYANGGPVSASPEQLHPLVARLLAQRQAAGLEHLRRAEAARRLLLHAAG